MKSQFFQIQQTDIKEIVNISLIKNHAYFQYYDHHTVFWYFIGVSLSFKHKNTHVFLRNVLVTHFQEVGYQRF